MSNKQLDLGLIDTQEKAYLLGLQKADGVKASGSIGLKVSDLSLLESISDFFQLKSARVYEARPDRLSSDGFARLAMGRFSSWFKKNLGNDYSLIPGMNAELTWHFIRGLFDGDGCVSLESRYQDAYPDGAVPGEFYLLFNYAENAHFIADFISKELGINRPKVLEIYGMGLTPIYKIRWAGTKQLEKIREHLYLDATLYLDRKRFLFDQIKSTFRGAGSSKGGAATAKIRWAHQRENRNCLYCENPFNVTLSSKQRFCCSRCGYKNRKRRPPE